jgi:hypothetical protein
MAYPAIVGLMVPEWYLVALRKGVSQEKRRDMVREACLKQAQSQAAKRGEVVPDSIAEEVVMLTYEMYEFSLSLSGGV